MKRVAWICLGWLLVISANSYAAGEALPPEVRALIGMKLSPVQVEGKDIERAPWAKPLPPDYVQLNPANIPDFISHGGVNLRIEQSGEFLSMNEGMYKNRWPVFLIVRITENRVKEILDAQLLPVNLINWRFKAGSYKYEYENFERISGRFSFGNCQSNVDDSQFIFGLIKPEYDKAAGCVHAHSEHVAQAWQVNKLTGLSKPISTQGLRCDYMEQLEVHCE